MTTPSNAMPDALAGPPATPPPARTTTRPLYWSVRRELWENRSVTIAPLAAAAVVLFGLLIGTIVAPHNLRAITALEPARLGAALAQAYGFAGFPITVTATLVAVFYCLGALHNERRDRSILFWKSLPVSDLVTVISKASVPLVVLPLVTFAVIVATRLMMLLLGTVVLPANGLSPAPLWIHFPWLQLSLVPLYGVTVQALWYAPVYGWLMLVSGWARRAPFLWAFLPPLALCLFEKIAFGTSHLASLLGYRLAGSEHAAYASQVGSRDVVYQLAQLDPGKFLSSPDLWVGLAVAAAFLAAAVWLRRYREPI